MKKLVLLGAFIMFVAIAFCQSFVNPVGFVETDSSKARVIAFIKKKAQEEYTLVGEGQSLKMMEKESLRAFKKLTKASNTSLLNQIIKTYNDTGLYSDYRTLLVEYRQQSKATLKW